MPIDRGDIDELAKSDFDELVEARVPEGLRLEYKRGLYSQSDKDRHEILKDVSALANSYGGHLLLGVEANRGSASRVLGVECPDADAEVLRMEQMLRAGIDPPISGIRMKYILMDGGRYLFAIRIPRSWHPPHRVTRNSSNRFYIRHSSGVHEASIEELRKLFTQSTTVLEHARSFRDERIMAVCAGEGNRPLGDHGRLFLHIFPAAASAEMANINIESVYASHASFRPMGATGITSNFNYFGFINERGGPENLGYTQVFRNGCLEATKARIRSAEGGAIPGLPLERYIFAELSSYITGLRDLGVQPPLILMFTLEGVRGAHYGVMHTYENQSPLAYDVMRLPECIIEDYGETVDYHRAVRSAFDALWNAIGYPSSRFFNEEGLWVGPPR